MHARVVLALIGLTCFAGCASASPSIPTASGSGEPLAPDACPTVSLRSPAGAPIDLTGLWRAPDSGTYYLRQYRSCVWFMGLSPDTGSPGRVGTSDWTNSFFGSVASDFTLQGSWADVPWGNDAGVGELTWQIRNDEVDGQETVTLNLIQESGGFGGEFLLRPESDADLRVRLQDSVECLTVMDEAGDEYELATLPPGWSVGAPLQLVGPGQAQILPSVPFEVTGEVARGTGFCSTGLIMFVDSIEGTVTP